MYKCCELLDATPNKLDGNLNFICQMNMNIIIHKIWDVTKIQPVEPMTICPRADNTPNQQQIKIAKMA